MIDGVRVEKRRVAVPGNSILYDPKTVPPEWRMWLHKTRQAPPSDEEMARCVYFFCVFPLACLLGDGDDGESCDAAAADA